jgi:hypothetical protein
VEAKAFRQLFILESVYSVYEAIKKETERTKLQKMDDSDFIMNMLEIQHELNTR